MEAEQVIMQLKELYDIFKYPTIVVISGGEPLMQGGSLIPLVRDLDRIGCSVHIETAGTLMPPATLNRYISQYVVSPKLAHSGNTLTKRRKLNTLKWFATHDGAWFKFVMKSVDDFDEIDEIVAECAIPHQRVMVMPEGTTQEAIKCGALVIEPGALSRRYGLSMRQHVTLHGDKRRF